MVDLGAQPAEPVDRLGVGEDLEPGEDLVEVVQAHPDLDHEPTTESCPKARAAIAVGLVLGDEYADVERVSEAELADPRQPIRSSPHAVGVLAAQGGGKTLPFDR